MRMAGMGATDKLAGMRAHAGMRVPHHARCTAMCLPCVAVHVYMRTRVCVRVSVELWCRCDLDVGTECYAKDASAICSPGAPLAPAPLAPRPWPLSALLDLDLLRP